MKMPQSIKFLLVISALTSLAQARSPECPASCVCPETIECTKQPCAQDCPCPHATMKKGDEETMNACVGGMCAQKIAAKRESAKHENRKHKAPRTPRPQQ